RRDRTSPDPTPGKFGPSPLTTPATWSRWLLLGTALAAGGPAVPAPVALAVAGLGFVGGVPHGAVDHVIAARLADRPIGLVAAVYAGVAAAAWALLQWADPLALILAVALSALHFGLGELDVVHRVAGWRPPARLALPIVVAGSGALLLPLARCGDQLRAVATTISPALASLIGRVPVQTGLVVVWLLAALVAVAGSVRSGHNAVAVDIATVGAVGMLAPPLVAFAVWFGGWHALRHGARILTVEPGCAALLTAGRTRTAVLRLVRLAAVPTLAAWATLAGLTWCTVTAPDPTVVVAEVLRLLLALTVPHALVVLWLDRVAARRPITPAGGG
ncbi:Brp/Blh family beta-carotene 15,15'-dioxygenase, partial [Mycobacterium sp. Marseille-P9652]|uniref:Brp/Blh family beta-carotene 15,15'-dioxygenase n=1 Tax=Mycobacterium sp. Marseille-P9652 TaxID=2654950 RepID=UPI0012E8B8D5